jgi:alanine-glyoxylate transaminase/serine-glyoxylate transaminase/serine-pyruvate transaminase
MTNTFPDLSPSPRLLLGPGPSPVHPRVMRAMSAGVLGHLDGEFLNIMTEVQNLLRAVFQTKNPFTFPVSGTGMAGMECAIVNLIEPGDKMVVCAAGYFGERIADVARRAQADVTILSGEWGASIPLEKNEAALEKDRPKVLSLVQGETSTGVLQPIEPLGRLCHHHGALLLVDAVTSLATAPLDVESWEIDAIYSGSQKGLGCPPGLAPVSFSARAVEVMQRRTTPVQSYYLDAVQLMKYWGAERQYHHTAPITNIYALREGLRVALEEGLQQRWQRHRQTWQALQAGLRELGISYLTKEDCQLPALSCVRIPDGVEDLSIRKRLVSEFGIEIGGGLGVFKGKAWRIGLMGYGSRPENVLTLLSALERCLGEHRACKPGASLAAAQAALAQD